MASKYQMTISPNVLNHLGLSLYSNTPAVLAEVIANAWDADATEVRIDFDLRENSITVTDNGVGMDEADINGKYLYVGYRKRDSAKGLKTQSGRLPMGRKGIGKLSLFSIADLFAVYSKKAGSLEQALLMDAEKLKAAIKKEQPSSPSDYHPRSIEFDAELVGKHGTCIRIQRLKKVKLTAGSVSALRKRIARRFGIIARDDFQVFINGERVTFADRDYFHKARFIFQYGSHDYAQHCNNLDNDDQTGPLSFKRDNRFGLSGQTDDNGAYEINGWIAIARHSNDLDGQDQEDNLNKITIAVRGKVALEDILKEYRLGGMITKYIYGEINADFLDDDAEADIATSSRQGIAEDDPRYLALRAFLEKELKHIWTHTNRLKDKKGLEQALASNPHIKEWYEKLRPKTLRDSAKKIFAAIDKAGVDEVRKQSLYADGVLAFETLKLNSALDKLDRIDETNLDLFLEYLADVDSIEAVRYYEIVQERLSVIEKLKNMVDENLYERVLQEHIYERLWLFDPAWDRATGERHMEERLQRAVGSVSEKGGHVRLDIRYRSVPGTHVIIELKRARRPITTGEIMDQINAYIDALKSELAKTPKAAQFPIEAVCLLDRLPTSWKNAERRQRDENALAESGIRVMTYTGLIESARSRYRAFSQASEEASDLHRLIEKIRTYGTLATSEEIALQQ